MDKDQYVLNTEGTWKEGPIEVWFEELEGLIERLKDPGESDPEETHSKEDDLLWDFVRFTYERSTEPCIHAMCDALFELAGTDRTMWYA